MATQCPKCQSENPNTAKFCSECATPIQPSKDIGVTKTLETPVEEFTRGTTFADRYEIIEVLGKGGMGTVYKVEDTKIGQDIALKLIKPEIASDRKTIERFRNELKTTRMISHRNVCRMFDLGEAENKHFITMEYVPGEDLKSLIRRVDRFDTGTAIKIAKQVCEGLDEAHRLGVIHRDLKPSNVMIDKEGNARIMDFGIAMSLRAKGLTGEGIIIGTPEYMSPEQTEAKEIDSRSDIYSLGVILYEMVTGKVPFEGDTPLNVVVKHKTEAPPNPKDFNAQVPDEISRLILKCMQKNKEIRFQSAGEVRAELAKIEEGIPTAERVIPKRRIEIKGKKLLLYGSSAVLLILLILAGISLFTVRQEAIDSIAILPLENLSGDPDQEYIVDGMHEALITNLSKVGALKRVIARTSVMRYKDTDKAVSEIARELGVDVIIEGSVLRVGDRVRITAQLIDGRTDAHLWAESYEREWRDILKLQGEVAQAIAREIQAALTPEEEIRLASARSVNPEAHEAYLKGRYYFNKHTAEGYRTSIEYFQQAIEKDPNYALAYAGLADSYSYLADVGVLPPREGMPKAKAAAMKALELDDTLAEAHTSLGMVIMQYDWDWAEAKKEFQRAIELNPNSADAHLWYGYYLRLMGRYDEALAEKKRARTLDPLSLFINLQIGRIYYYAGQFDQAIEEHKKTLEMDPNFPMLHLALSQSYLKKEMYEEALAEAQKTLALSGGDPWALALLGSVYGASGRKNEAMKVLDELKKRRHVAPFQLATIYESLGEKDQAFEWLERSYEARDAWIIWLRSPLFGSLRSDPRFKALLKKIGLEE